MQCVTRTINYKKGNFMNTQVQPQQTELAVQDMTNEQARTWLLTNDPEGAEIWSDVGADDLVHAVRDNLSDFGEADQDGEFLVSLNEPTLRFVSMHWVNDGMG
jgi:hypothetical protein